MRRALHIAATVAALLSFPGPSEAEGLSSISDLDLLEKTRDAVVAQDAEGALILLTEMQRRGTGIFAGAEKAVCEEAIDLPEGITDWRFRVLRGKPISPLQRRSAALEEGACGLPLRRI